MVSLDVSDAHVEVRRILAGSSDNSFEKSSLLQALAVRLQRQGNLDGYRLAMGRAREEIVKSGPQEERPRELCKVARRYAAMGQRELAEQTLNVALALLDKIRQESPWKFTNYLCLVAWELAKVEAGTKTSQEILERAVESLPAIDAHYANRKQEVLSLLRGIPVDEEMRHYLNYSPEGAEPHTRSGVPYEQTMQFLCSYVYLDAATIKCLKESVHKGGVPLQAVNVISDAWRRSVALAFFSRLCLGGHDAERALMALSLAEEEAAAIPFYWVKDNALEVLSGTYLEVHHMDPGRGGVLEAQRVALQIKDPWKRSRALCRIAEVHRALGEWRLAAEKLNLVFLELLGRIDYRERAAMSMFLMADVFDVLGEGKWPTMFNRNRRKATALRTRAKAILKSMDEQKMTEALEEYERFISLAGMSSGAEQNASQL